MAVSLTLGPNTRDSHTPAPDVAAASKAPTWGSVLKGPQRVCWLSPPVLQCPQGPPSSSVLPGSPRGLCKCLGAGPFRPLTEFTVFLCRTGAAWAPTAQVTAVLKAPHRAPTGPPPARPGRAAGPQGLLRWVGVLVTTVPAAPCRVLCVNFLRIPPSYTENLVTELTTAVHTREIPRRQAPHRRKPCSPRTLGNSL